MRFKYFIKIICSFILLMFFTSCSTFNASLDTLLVSPKVDNILVGGTWTVENFYYMYETNSKMGPKIPLDSYLFLSNDYLRINDIVFEYENYKVKTTTLSDYMRVKFKIRDFSFLNLDDKEINVFSIQDENKNVYEFLKYDDDTLLFYYDDNIMYVLKKISDKIDKNLENYVKDNYKNNIFNKQSGDIVNTGFLIGFKSEREVVDSSIPKSDYKTIWFFQSDEGSYSYKIFDDIIIPKNGDILTIKVESSEKNSLYEKIVINRKILNGDGVENIIKSDNTNEEFINQFIDLTYVNENYIGINYDQNTEYLGKIDTDKLAMLSIDEPYIERRLKFSDIFKYNKKDFYTSRKKFLDFVDKQILEMYDSEVREDSFKLLRYAGSWFLRGRINPKTGYDVSPIDFDIEVLPNDTLVKNNDLSINLGQIKLKQPDVLDAFISPNRDIMVTLTKENMYVYKIIGDKVSNNTIGEFSIKKDDIVILSEWYVSEEAEKINELLEEVK